MSEYLSGSYFDVSLSGAVGAIASLLGAGLSGRFLSVSGLNMEMEYEPFREGGSLYTRFYVKAPKPQVLVLEQGILADGSKIALLMQACITGILVPLTGIITLKDSFGDTQRSWTIQDAYLQKYIGPELNSNQPTVAVHRLEFLYNGCF